MLQVYLNTQDGIFLDHKGDIFRDAFPQFAAISREKLHFKLVSTSPGYGSGVADTGSWQADTSWAEDGGISAMLTIDNDYRHRIKGTTAADITTGAQEVMIVFPSGTSAEVFPLTGEVTIFDVQGNGEHLGYSSRSVAGNSVTFALDTPVVNSYPSGSAADAPQSPLAWAYLDAENSNWATGDLYFDLAVDSLRLRNLTEYADTAKIDIAGVELLFYRADGDSLTIVRRYLWDTPSLVNTLGNPGYPAKLPDAKVDYIISEVERQVTNSTRNPLEFQFSIDGVADWHETQTADDRFFRQRIANLDAAWSDAIMLITGTPGKDGADGVDGKDGTDGTNGADGYTPVRGTDYWTESDKAEIKAYVDNSILNGAW